MRHNKHNPIKEKSERLECTWEGCTKSYVFKHSLKTHIDQIHRGNKKTSGRIKNSHKPLALENFECDLCGKICHKKHRIIAHLRQHLGLKVKIHTFLNLNQSRMA